MDEHETAILSGDDGFWMVCTCGYNVLLGSFDVAEAYAADHRAVFVD